MIAPLSLAEPRGGDAVRTLAIARHLAQEVDLTLMSSTTPQAYADLLPQIPAKRHLFLRVDRVGYWSVLARTLRGLTYDSARFRIRNTPALSSADHFDAVWLETPRAWDVYRSLGVTDDIVLVADLQNDDPNMWQQRVTTEKPWYGRAISAIYGRRSASKFRVIAERANLIFCVSSADSEALSAREGPAVARKTFVLANGVDYDRFQRPPTVVTEPKSAIFVGSLDTRMNQIAVRELLTSYWPAVLQLVPDAVLTIAGRNPPRWLMSQMSEFVRIVASPPDIRPLLWGSSVFLAPFPSGTGTKIKVIEAMAAGLPVVGTTATFQGLSVSPGTDTLLIKDAHEAAIAVQRLFSETGLATTLSKAAQRTAARYDWASTIEMGLRLLAGTLSRKG